MESTCYKTERSHSNNIYMYRGAIIESSGAYSEAGPERIAIRCHIGRSVILKTADKTTTLNPSETAPDVIPLPMESGTDAPPSGVLLKHTKHGKGGTLKRGPSFLERQAAERSRVTMETFELSETHYNQCVKKGAFEGHEKDRYIRSRGSEPTDESSSLENGG